ncbi:MAG: aminodeoxychorismate synthase component I, partial [Deltaproteobacteria bacterium]|nr:aminodeoxychorismate synthase component I [Deltaproteobacteria bacterium]
MTFVFFRDCEVVDESIPPLYPSTSPYPSLSLDFARDRQERGLRSNFTRESYCSAVQKIIDHIREGDIYQANLSQRFEVPFTADPFDLFTAIDRVNPAPMMAYLHLPEVTLISTSPERFLKRTGTLLETSPIKGTRPRGKTLSDDQRLRDELWTSEKDGAELAMIVDLMRNDLGRVANPGSVVVTDPKRVEAYTNVFHLVATVQAEVAPMLPALEIIRACFPAGSITGCPKIRAMEIIDELEPAPRSFCYGSIGWLDFNGDFDFNVAIRTFIARDGKLFFNLGGGIVADSDPEAEYEESLHKGQSMFEVLQLYDSRPLRANPERVTNSIVTREGFRAERPAVVKPPSGIFETICSRNGQPEFLDEHLERLRHACEMVGWGFPGRNYENLIAEALEQKNITQQLARVRVVVKKNEVLIETEPYTPSQKWYTQGVSLKVMPHPNPTPSAQIKLCDREAYDDALRQAHSEGFDECLFVHEGRVLEGATTNVIVMHDGKCLIPSRDDFRLVGIMEQKI